VDQLHGTAIGERVTMGDEHEGHIESVSTRIGSGFSRAEISAVLAGAPFLDGLSPEVVADVVSAFERVELAGDSQLLRSDVPNDSLYVVVHGALRTLARDGGGRERVVAESYRGDSLGLLGLLERVAAPIDVYAIRDCVLLRLRRERFRELGMRNPVLVLRLAEGIARRGLQLFGLTRAWMPWSRPGAVAQNIALLLPTGDRYFAQAASALALASLERYRHLAHVTRAFVDQALGEGAAAIAPSDSRQEQVLAFLQSLEPGSEIVLYESDSSSGPWCDRCLRQADRVLAILHADRPDHIAELRPILERTLRRRQVPQLDLALVHPEHADLPRGTVSWAWLQGKARIHHVRTGDHADYQRLARTILRSGVGVVLSGGGARGIAHIGVLKALEEAGVPVDHIGGTSMGSIVAAGYARGWSADTIMEHVRQLFRSRTALYDPTIPFESLLAGRKLERVLRTYFADFDIEDLWLPFFCVSSDLSRAERRVHDQGELWSAVAASCSIPGIFPPVRARSHLLVDGGVVDNLPIDVMAARFDGAIIASDVNLYNDTTPERRGITIDRLRDFARWITPFAKGGRGPEIFEILLRSSQIGSQRATRESLERGDASLYLPIPVQNFRLLDWGANEALYRAGYEYASTRLSTWQPPYLHSAAADSQTPS
jgi:predicted acylesterase/phospholipase RssA/CRP-like cAMP-binding protein